MSKVKNLAYMGLMTAIMCILSPISIPTGTGVGITLGIFVVLLMTYILGTVRGLICYLIYMMVGIVGLPVFSGFQGGLGVIMGPTGGYLLGYIFIIVCAGTIQRIKKEKKVFFIIGSFVGLLLCYIVGSVWYMNIMDVKFKESLLMSVVPFVLFDIIKVILVYFIGPLCKNHVK